MSNEQREPTANEATLAFWRAAESGDVNELAAILPRVPDINARNEHGMTALMRAAQNGHVKIVRMLLEEGADANVKRNDKFTALALAAFFGHTAAVRVLMEHGADCDARTRGGTSPRMWATARTFGETAGHLETRRVATVATVKAQKQTEPAPAATPVVKTAPAVTPVVKTEPIVPVVKTLKDPPEIWDLVHEVPKGFDARSAFVCRLQTMRASWTLRLATVVILISACAVGVLVLRGAQARSAGIPAAPEASSSSPASTVSVPASTGTAESGSGTVESGSVTAETSPQPPASAVPDVVEAPSSSGETGKPFVGRKLTSRSRQNSSHSVERERTPPLAAIEPIATAPAPKSETEASPATETKPRTSTPLSPQLITPAKSVPPKTKVIQWP